MKRRSFLKSLLAILAAAWSRLSLLAAEARRPNVLLIVTDQQFADAMSCRMGAEQINTPAIDSLAEQGMVFARAYCPSPLCMPSRNSIFTGRYPHQTGVTKNELRDIDSQEFVGIGKYFRRAGYETAYFGKTHLCPSLTAEFDSVIADPPKDHDKLTTAAAVKFISEKHDKPVLVVVSLMNPHNVCELARGQALPDGPIGAAPPPEQCPPAPVNIAPQEDEPDAMTVIRRGYQANPLFPVGDFDEDDWRRLRWGYYRLIEKVDAQIGEVLAALRTAGMERDTVVAFTSDHGECAGAHGLNQKTVFYEESVRVPLIVCYPGRTKAGLSDELANTGTDILPTLLDFAGADEEPTKLTGRSLRPLALGEPAQHWRDHVVVESDMDQSGMIGDFRPIVEGRMVRTDRFKYCVFDRGIRRESLVDMQTDPGETKNLAGDPTYREILLKHRELLARFAREHNDTLAAEMLADGVPPKPFAARASEEPSGGAASDGR